jgi:hypothetical protein
MTECSLSKTPRHSHEEFKKKHVNRGQMATDLTWFALALLAPYAYLSDLGGGWRNWGPFHDGAFIQLAAAGEQKARRPPG